MAVLNVNPTRMELTNLKRKLVTARRGYKLLKDKRDELMRQFLILVRENKQLRRKVEEEISAANEKTALAAATMDDDSLELALMMPGQRMSVEVGEKNVMSVIVPEYKPEFKTAADGEIYSYGYAFTAGELDSAVSHISSIMHDLLLLAEREKQCSLMAMEIERTRRRVNALENVMIPNYADTIKYITMKLDENDRSATTRLMKVKDMMLEKAHHYKQ